jgi:aryl-alcohol dehydrogenase-like predicted oxidoreductase
MLAHQAGFGVVVKEALANGRLTGRNDDPAFAPTRRRLEATSPVWGRRWTPWLWRPSSANPGRMWSSAGR